jgi:DNA modification methylase
MARRTAGPPTALGARASGDPHWGEVLKQALIQDGSIDRGTHGFHAYPARMHPDCAAQLIAQCPGHVHDPFCGGGTVLLEARLAGRECSGTDLSPIAVLVSEARCSPPELATPLRSASRKIADLALRNVEVQVPELADRWYQPHVAQELGRIRDGIKVSNPIAQPLLRAVLSSILVKVSFRESDTSNRHSPHRRHPGTTATLFHKKARELGRAIEAMAPGPAPAIRLGDARRMGSKAPAGLILTSPPYPGIFDYLPMHQLRYAWLGIDAGEALAGEIGARRTFRAMGRQDALREWRADTDAWIATQARGLAPGGRMVIVVGDGLVGGKIVDTLSPTVESLRTAGLNIVARASADRADHAREMVRIEHMVMAQRD